MSILGGVSLSKSILQLREEILQQKALIDIYNKGLLRLLDEYFELVNRAVDEDIN